MMYKIIGVDRMEYGPVDSDQINHWIREGRVNEQTLVQEAGSNRWTAITEIPKFAATLNTQPRPPVATPAPATTGLPAAPVHVPSYLLPAILTTILCCTPFGIPAIFYAVRVNSKLNKGDFAGAQSDSAKARMWCWICTILGVILWIIMPWLLKKVFSAYQGF